jgi:predicted N-acyltransferase
MLQLASSPKATTQEALDIRIETGLASIDREAWNLCFAGEVENYDCLMAIEEAGIDGFEWRYITISEAGRIVAAVPFFLTDYKLDTTLDDKRARQVVHSVRRVWPRFATLRLACLGSPCTENLHVGFHPDIAFERRMMLFDRILTAFETRAAAEKCSLMGIKDVAQPTLPELAGPLLARSYASVGGLATAWMDIDFTSIDSYLERLSSGTRKDMRRKLKSLKEIRIERHSDFGGLLPKVLSLYHDTRNRSDWQFEELTEAYFSGILSRMKDRAFCTFYFAGDELLAANIMVHNDKVLIDKFFCMDSEAGRKHNLYFLSWFTNLQYCLDHGQSRYQSGQAYYENKVRLGSKLTRNTMYFRHRNPLLHRILRLISPLFETDEGEA